MLDSGSPARVTSTLRMTMDAANAAAALMANGFQPLAPVGVRGRAAVFVGSFPLPRLSALHPALIEGAGLTSSVSPVHASGSMPILAPWL
jgi:hypothetical protein